MIDPRGIGFTRSKSLYVYYLSAKIGNSIGKKTVFMEPVERDDCAQPTDGPDSIANVARVSVGIIFQGWFGFVVCIFDELLYVPNVSDDIRAWIEGTRAEYNGSAAGNGYCRRRFDPPSSDGIQRARIKSPRRIHYL